MYIDQYGNDPLLDPMWDIMQASTTIHTVTQGEEGNPQSVAYKHYNSVDYYKFILAYNGLRHPSEFVAGLTVMIPTIVLPSQAPVTISI
jgi:hypothetical protein